MNAEEQKVVSKNKNHGIRWIRRILLAIFFIFITYHLYMQQVIRGGIRGCSSVNTLCPFRGLESFYSLWSSGIFIRTLIIFGFTVLLAVLFRRSFCGLICPLGALQEFFGWIGKKLFGKRLVMSKKIDNSLRYLKYIIFVAFAIAAWNISNFWMGPYCPWAAYSHMLGGWDELITKYAIGFAILVITLIGSMFYDRFFCKYLCPMGALLGIISKISPNHIHRNLKEHTEEGCIHCGICSKNCPMNIDVANTEEVRSAECINCQECIVSCPMPKALEVRQGKKAIGSLTLIVLVMLVFFGGNFITKTINMYSIQTNLNIKRGEVNHVDDIRGFMTLEEVAKVKSISLEETYKKLNIKGNVPKEAKMKDLKNYFPELEMERIRELLKK
jgi:polyferredoxin